MTDSSSSSSQIVSKFNLERQPLTPLNVLQANAQSSFTQNNTSYATTPGGNFLNNLKTNSLLATSNSIPHLSQTQEMAHGGTSSLEENYKQRLKDRFQDHASRQGSIQQTISENNQSQGDIHRLKNNEIGSFDRKPSRSSFQIASSQNQTLRPHNHEDNLGLQQYQQRLLKTDQNESTGNLSQKQQSRNINDDSKVESNHQLDSIFERISNLRQNLKNSMLNTSESKSSLAPASNNFQNLRPRSSLSPLLSSNHQNFQHFQEIDKPSSDLTTGLNSVKAALSNQNYQVTNQMTTQNTIQDGTQQMIFQDTQRQTLNNMQLNTPAFSIDHRKASINMAYSDTHQFSQNQQSTIQIEEKLRQEMDFKYRSRLEELEQRSAYLDRSLELIEEMKQKFSQYENQQMDYNQLLIKYNQLLLSQSVNNISSSTSQIMGGHKMIMTQKNGLLSNSNSQLHIGNPVGGESSNNQFIILGAHQQQQQFQMSNQSLTSQIPPSHLNLLSPMHHSNKQQQLKHQDPNNAGSTPGLNFQISTMNEEDQHDTYQSARIQGGSSHTNTNQGNNPSITLQRVTITQPDHTHSTSRMHPNYIDASNHLESQVHSTLIALDQQSQSLLNNEKSAESLSMNLIDDSGKENQNNGAANYYEHENRKLRVMNEQLLQEISQVKAARQPIIRKQNSSSSIGRRQQHHPVLRCSNLRVVKSPNPVQRRFNSTSGGGGYRTVSYTPHQNTVVVPLRRKQQHITNTYESFKNLPYHTNTSVINYQTRESHYTRPIKKESHSPPMYLRRAHSSGADKSKASLNDELEAFQKVTFAELHKRIDLLESQKRQLKLKLKNAQQPQCCCQDLILQGEEKEYRLTQLADHWRSKTELLVAKYYRTLQVVREDQNKIRLSTVEAIQQMRQMQDHVTEQVLKKQRETQVYFEKKLLKKDKELREARKRIIQQRYDLKNTTLKRDVSPNNNCPMNMR